MKILYDHQIFTSQKYGGISRYFNEVIKSLNKKVNDIKVSLLFSDNHYISDNKYVKQFKFLSKYKFRGKQRFYAFSNKLKSINILKRQNFDIFHPTYYDPYFLKYIGNKPFVLTVHDMIHEKFKENFSLKNKTAEHKKLLCDKANKIIAVSKNTKKDLVDILNIDESKIEVVYHGNSLIKINNNKNDFQLPQKYILYVGSRGVYKNFDRFIRAVSSIVNSDKTLSIICVGGGRFKKDEIKLFDTLNLKNKIFQYRVDDNMLSLLYVNAELFVFPSLYEGFGIPVIEAFSCGCPLVCSNTSSLPEIAGKGAEYFNPNDEKSIRIAVKNVLNSPDRKEMLKREGKNRLKYFSWEQTAIETKKVYKSIIK